jgi:CRISPR/Cas system CSM-associated protein Csm3 (group 7 of RAMP superfamily)
MRRRGGSSHRFIILIRGVDGSWQLEAKATSRSRAGIPVGYGRHGSRGFGKIRCQNATTGAEARGDFWLYAALKRRSSTALHAFVEFFTTSEGFPFPELIREFVASPVKS